MFGRTILPSHLHGLSLIDERNHSLRMFALGQDETIERDEFAKEEEHKIVLPK